MKFSAIIKDWANPWHAYLAEFLGTFVFVLVFSCLVLSQVFYGEIGALGIAIGSGLAYAVMMFATAHISGGHINPAVTLALWLSQKFSGSLAFFYITFQILGGILAAVATFYLFGARSLDFALGGPILSADVSMSAALALEAIFSAILVFVYFATMVDKHSLQSSSSQDSTAGLRAGPTSFGPLACGFVVILAAAVLLPITGASLSPARAIATGIFSQVYEGTAVSVVGPFVGSLVGIFYEAVFLRKKK